MKNFMNQCCFLLAFLLLFFGQLSGQMLEVTDAGSVSATEDGNIIFGSPTGTHLTMDGTEIQTKIGASFSTLRLNNFGGDVNIGENDLYIQNTTGEVGIGTSSPSVKLHVNGTGIDNDGVTAVVKIVSGNGAQMLLMDGNEIDAIADGLFLNNNTSEKVILANGGGLVGIGTSAPSEKLHVIGNRIKLTSPLDANKFLEFRTDGNHLDVASTGGKLFLSGNGGEGVVIQQSSGNVAIGDDSTPNYKLEVIGSAGKPGGGSWENSSDKRLKKDIKDFNYGLELVKKVHPIFYHYNGKENLPTDKEYVGVIAQELKEIAPFMVGEFPGDDGETYLSVDPSAFDFILVNAVKELSEKNEEQISNLQKENKEQHAIIEDLQKENKAQQQQIDDLKKMVESLLKNTSRTQPTEENQWQLSTTPTEELLFQNRPNPFTNETSIQYNLPKTANVAAIHITDLNGKILKTYPISGNGTGSVTVQAGALAAGIYIYSLEVDGALMATKKMILTK